MLSIASASRISAGTIRKKISSATVNAPSTAFRVTSMKLAQIETVARAAASPRPCRAAGGGATGHLAALPLSAADLVGGGRHHAGEHNCH
ncbi:hypothetical protein [Marivita sp.]|uniref:hypothetical protein n=1 Tax=Marivita sp. TaxID=2003365 RepID=UPI0025BC6E56|nr:hypothetical protein [Marivita sp.]